MIQRQQYEEGRKRQGERYVAEGCRLVEKNMVGCRLFLFGLEVPKRTLTLYLVPGNLYCNTGHHHPDRYTRTYHCSAQLGRNRQLWRRAKRVNQV